ncbi:MAG TPA: hypothetical protein VIO56_04175 [Methylotenera sp.]|jgi:hypothetical protein
MFFDWFNTKEAALLGIKLADYLSTEIAKNNNKNLKKANDHGAKVMQKIWGQLSEYQQQNKLNFLKKSKLANEFRWRLMENGHPEDFAESATKELLLHMN